jgi:hypothetical protein
MNEPQQSLAIGILDYKKLIEKKCYYIDKTLFIQELLSKKDEITLICRPRRFGKTINLSMLKYFFEYTEHSNKHLFEDKKIWDKQLYRTIQGTYPVIFLTFKDSKGITFDENYAGIQLLIAKEFKRHQKTLFSTLTEYDQKKYTALLTESASHVHTEDSLFFLSELLQAHYKKK